MNLSEKIINDEPHECVYTEDTMQFYYSENDLKQAIKELKEEMSKVNIGDGFGFTYLCKSINKIFGDELTK